MAGLNKVMLIGNLGQDPNFSQVGSENISKTTFSIATSERWGNNPDGTPKTHTEWHNITTWRKLAEICRDYLRKGTKVYIEGKIRKNTYTDKDNIEKTYYEIVADQLVILTSKKEAEAMQAENAQAAQTAGAAVNMDDDLGNTLL